jgi:hypothetical protein
MFQDEFEILGVVDHDSRWKCRDSYLEGLQTKVSLALHKPVEQDFSRRKELDGIAKHGKRICRTPGKVGYVWSVQK